MHAFLFGLNILYIIISSTVASVMMVVIPLNAWLKKKKLREEMMLAQTQGKPAAADRPKISLAALEEEKEAKVKEEVKGAQ